MIQMMIAESSKGERLYITEYSRNLAAYYTDELWNYFLCSTFKEVLAYIEDHVRLDMICLDITIPGVLRLTEDIRRMNQSAFLILIADQDISPLEYMKPSIMAGSLMLKPLKKAAVERCLKDSFKAFAARFESPDTEEVFVAENREGRWRIPYNRILFFESRDKKIFLYTEDQEIGFYGTLDELEDKLPDSFLRCHRSYILSRSKIRCLVPGKNSIQLEDDTLIPVSRSYRNIMKELRGKG